MEWPAAGNHLHTEKSAHIIDWAKFRLPSFQDLPSLAEYISSIVCADTGRGYEIGGPRQLSSWAKATLHLIALEGLDGVD